MKRPEKMSVFGLALLRLREQRHTRESFLQAYWGDYHTDNIVDALLEHGFVTYRGQRLAITERGQRRLAPEE